MIPDTIRYQDRWKWFLPASRSSLNPPGPPGKAKKLSFRTRKCYRKIWIKIIIFIINPFFGDPPGEMDQMDE